MVSCKKNPNMDDREARNFTLLKLLPLGLDTEWDKNTIIRTAVGNLTGMAYQIGIADEDIIITSDRPVVIWSPKEDEQHNRPSVMALTRKFLAAMGIEADKIDSIIDAHTETVDALKHMGCQSGHRHRI